MLQAGLPVTSSPNQSGGSKLLASSTLANSTSTTRSPARAPSYSSTVARWCSSGTFQRYLLRQSPPASSQSSAKTASSIANSTSWRTMAPEAASKVFTVMTRASRRALTLNSTAASRGER
ncbi:hypothetical protein RB200_02275 [Streptomyces sp. PmtG]